MTLTKEQLDLIKAGIPLMEEAGDAFLKAFYDKMIGENPSLLNIFSKTHQQTLDQPKALTRAVLLYAKNLDSVGNLTPLVERIVQKHVSLCVQPELYPVVGKYLLEALETQFGSDVATPEFLSAWGAAYNQLADILINAERSTYKANNDAVGGWENYRQFKIVDKIPETDNVTTFKFVPVDGGKVIVPQAGQYLGFKFIISSDDTCCRQYSISEFVKPCYSGASGYQVSVKRIPNGHVSQHWHDNVHVGTIIDVSPPAGEFILRHNPSSRNSILLLTAGIGITPAISLSHQALQSGLKVALVQCDHNGRTLPFKQQFEDLSQEFSSDNQFIHNVYLSTEKRFTKENLEELVSSPEFGKSDVYVLGPRSFMKDVKEWFSSLRTSSGERHTVYYDFFGPAQWDE